MNNQFAPSNLQGKLCDYKTKDDKNWPHLSFCPFLITMNGGGGHEYTKATTPHLNMEFTTAIKIGTYLSYLEKIFHRMLHETDGC